MKMSDPGPKEKKVTNADEQDVVVNHSTTDQGFDEPASSADSPEVQENPEKEVVPEVDDEEVEEDRTKSEEKKPDSFKK